MRASRLALAIPLVALATFAGGYGLGALRDGEGAWRAGANPDAGGGGGSDAGSGGLSALPGTGASGGGLSGRGRVVSQIARDGKLGMFVKLRAYLRLANSTPVAELPELLRQLGREVPEDLGGDALARIIAKRWAAADPQAAFAALLAGEPPLIGEAMEPITQAIAEADPDAAWEMVMAMGSAQRREMMLLLLLRKQMAHDPAAALERVVSMTGPLSYRGAVITILEDAAKVDPVAALAAVDRLPRGIAGDSFYLGAFEALAESDPDAARTRLAELKRSDLREAAVRGVAKALAATDAEAARAWVAGLPAAGERDAALVTLLATQSKTDPGAAAAAVSELRSPKHRAELVSQVAERYYSKDSAATLEWIDNELEGRARQNAYRSLLREHGREMPFERQLEVAEEISGEGRERRDFVERWARREPEAATEWAVRQGGRNSALVREAIVEWVDQDFEATEAFAAGIADERLHAIAEEIVDRRRDEMAAAKERGGDGD